LLDGLKKYLNPYLKLILRKE